MLSDEELAKAIDIEALSQEEKDRRDELFQALNEFELADQAAALLKADGLDPGLHKLGVKFRVGGRDGLVTVNIEVRGEMDAEGKPIVWVRQSDVEVLDDSGG